MAVVSDDTTIYAIGDGTANRCRALPLPGGLPRDVAPHWLVAGGSGDAARARCDVIPTAGDLGIAGSRLLQPSGRGGPQHAE